MMASMIRGAMAAALGALMLMGSGCARQLALAPEPVLLPLPLERAVTQLDAFPGVYDAVGTQARWLIERYPEATASPDAPAAPYRVERRIGERSRVYAGYIHPGVAPDVYILQLVPGALPIDEGLAQSHFALASTLYRLEVGEDGGLKLWWLEGRSLLKMSGDGVQRLPTKDGEYVLVGDAAALIDGAEYARVGGMIELEAYVQGTQSNP